MQAASRPYRRASSRTGTFDGSDETPPRGRCPQNDRDPISAPRSADRVQNNPDIFHRAKQRRLLGRPRSRRTDRRTVLVQGLRIVVCKAQHPLDGMCNGVFIRKIRARPEEQRQYACIASGTPATARNRDEAPTQEFAYRLTGPQISFGRRDNMRIMLAIPAALEQGGALVGLPTDAGFRPCFIRLGPTRSREIFRGVR
jgi:hypothetical protein